MNQVKVSHVKGKLEQELIIGRHHLVADESESLGGEDNGPAPHDFLVAALGSCKAITRRMYAQRKHWPLENAEVLVNLEKEGDLAKFDVKIELFGALTQEQKDRLLEIADRCPVHKTLSGKIEIHSALV
jgi:putative redox protein